MLFGVKANVGSNPTVTAKENPRETGGFLHSPSSSLAALMIAVSVVIRHFLYQWPAKEVRGDAGVNPLASGSVPVP
jgi:hypothetical protein